MSAPTSIANNVVVSIHYTLTNSDGETIDSSRGGDAMAYLHGAGNIVPGLEKELTGKAVGDVSQVVVAPEHGYGVRQGPEPQKVPLDSFPEDAKLETGMMIMAQGEDDAMFPLWVVGVGDDHAVLDHNHPLADVTLHFDVEVMAMREATEEEVAHGHPHGPDGHHHH